MSSSASVAAITAAQQARAPDHNVVLELPDEEMKERLAALIKNPPKNSRVVLITPAVAEWILNQYNTRNRPKTPSNIIKYADAMARGRKRGGWRVTGDTIKFTDKNRLGDGQNRLLACVKSGKSFWTHVVFGIDDGYFEAFDRGKNRQSSDTLAIDGYSYAKHLAAAVVWADKFENDPWSRKTLEPYFVRDLMKDKYGPSGIEECVEDARDIYKATGHPVGVVAAFLYLAKKADAKMAAKFTAQYKLGGGKTTKPHDGQLKGMCDALTKLKKMTSGRIHDTQRAAWLVLAWNGMRAKKPMNAASFKWTTVDAFPEISGLKLDWYETAE